MAINLWIVREEDTIGAELSMSKGFGCFLQVKPPPGESASVRERDLVYPIDTFLYRWILSEKGGFSPPKGGFFPEKGGFFFENPPEDTSYFCLIFHSDFNLLFSIIKRRILSGKVPLWRIRGIDDNTE